MRYEQENNSVYMVMDANSGDASMRPEMKMLANNRIESLLPVSVRNVNMRCAYYYDVTSRQQFAKMYEYRKLTRENVENIIKSLDRVQRDAAEYMLDMDRIILNAECIYVDVSRDRLVFAYGAQDMSEEIEDFRHGLKRLFEFVIEHYDHSGSDADVIYAYNIYQRIVQGDYDIFNLKELAVKREEDEIDKPEMMPEDNDMYMDCVAKEIVEDEEEIEDKAAVTLVTVLKGAVALIIVLAVGRMLAPSYVPIPISDVAAFVMILAGVCSFAALNRIPLHSLTRMKHKKDAQPYIYKSKEMSDNRHKSREMNDNRQSESEHFGTGENFESPFFENFGTDNVQEKRYDIGGDGSTVLLSDYLKEKKNVRVRLRYRDGDENSGEMGSRDIDVNKLPWIIGNMDRHCDTVIGNRLISHIHACITKVDDEYFIEDMNSTNGTYVNGERLMMNSRQKISNSDVITLASISYVVEMS